MKAGAVTPALGRSGRDKMAQTRVIPLCNQGSPRSVSVKSASTPQ